MDAVRFQPIQLLGGAHVCKQGGGGGAIQSLWAPMIRGGRAE